jgi:heptosyltransferase-2
VALCPGARHPTKRWPEAHWIALDRALRERGLRRLVISLAAERRALPGLSAALEGDAGARWVTEPLPRLAALLSRCGAAVSGDSGLMHLAAARGPAVVALFGSTAPELGFAPAGPGHEVLCRHEPCQPCTLHGRERCPRRHFRCMVELGLEPVLAALDRALARPRLVGVPSPPL